MYIFTYKIIDEEGEVKHSGSLDMSTISADGTCENVEEQLGKVFRKLRREIDNEPLQDDE